ncbi:12946_t:CDS:10 [Funneliformis mosseae]|uniref:12946_t:CDS:1 n=1 Tax=Funneliformis mosseae TaxID=27381 RepID=A0A9N9E3D9_FUNMO|nr:12946_t:CDS:10 [Funneliformis mosseae]
MTFINDKLLADLYYPDYWNRNPTSWGSISDWDMYYINQIPGCSKRQAHRTLALELKVLLQHLQDTSCGYSKAAALKRALSWEVCYGGGSHRFHHSMRCGKCVMVVDLIGSIISCNCDKDPANLILWNNHCSNLATLAIEDRVNKREIQIFAVKKEILQYKSERVLVDHSSEIEEIVTSATPAIRLSSADLQQDYNEEEEKPIKELQDKEVEEVENEEDEFTFQDKELFTQRQSMKDDKKWKLSTGTYVEDVLYNLGIKCRYYNLVHSFIIDSEDKFVQSGFTSDELTEIRETKSMYESPQIDNELLGYIDSFAKDSTKDIRKALYSSYPRLCENYNPLVDFPYEHVRTTVSDWVRLLEMEPNPLTITQDLPESWFRINVWRTVDIAFSDLPFVFFVGGEKAGLATKDRKNCGRTLSNIGPMQRKAIGKKGDGYVQSFGSRSIDWAASEAGSKWKGEKGTKIIKECSLALPKVCIVLIRFLELNLIELLTPRIYVGANLIKTNLDCLRGYVCRYMRQVPLEIYADVKQFNRTLDALVSIIYAKLEILNTMKIINNTTNSSDNLKRWKNLPKKTEEFDVPDCHPTPKKRRVANLQ